MGDKRAPKVRFKGFTDAWELRQLGDLLKHYSHKPYLADPNETGTFAVIQQGDNPIVGYSNGEAFDNYQNVVLFGDHTVSLYKPQTPFFIATDGVKILYADAINGDFLYSMLERYKPEPQGYKRHLSILRNKVAYYPKMAEQMKVGEFFSRLDYLVTLHQRKLEKLQELKKAFLELIFSQQLRFAGFSDVWELRQLGDLGKTQSGIGFSESEQGRSDGIPFFKISDMNNYGNEHEMKTANNYVNNEQLQRRKWKPVEDVPCVIFAKVGAAIMLDRKRLVRIPFLIDNNLMAYLFDESWDVDFGKTLFDTIFLPRYAQAGALPSYNGPDIEGIDVHIPIKEEQVEIAKIFVSLGNLITLHQNKLDKLQELKKAFLDNMFV